MTRRLLIAWAVAATAAACLFAAWWAPLQRAATAREDVTQAATTMALHVTTFEGATIDGWVEDGRTQATGDYADQLTTLFDQDLRGALRDREVRSVGEVVDLFVQDVSVGTGEATVFAVMRQTIVNRDTPEPVSDELRVELEMRREGGRWLASNISVLGPSALAGTGDLAP